MTGDLRTVLAVAVITTPLSFVAAADESATLGGRFPGQRSDESITCSRAISESGSWNGWALFQGARACFTEERHFDGNFLLIAGQIRSLTDLFLLLPVGDADEIEAGNLYGLIFYQAGGVGYDQLYRDPALTEKLFDRLGEWKPSFFDGYDPGWRYKQGEKLGAYDEIAAYNSAARVAQLTHYAELIRRDDYFAASQEFAELQQRNPGGFVEGTPDADRADELTGKMHELAQSIAMPTPKLEPPDMTRFEADPDANFEQVWTGFNGPESGELLILESEESIRNSWISRALGKRELNVILSEVDFKNQIVVAFAIGERSTATGTMYINKVSYNAILESLFVGARVGVNEAGCKFLPAKSYPFALAVAERPPQVPASRGNGVSNFPDGCKQPKSGTPLAPAEGRP